MVGCSNGFAVLLLLPDDLLRLEIGRLMREIPFLRSASHSSSWGEYDAMTERLATDNNDCGYAAYCNMVSCLRHRLVRREYCCRRSPAARAASRSNAESTDLIE